MNTLYHRLFFFFLSIALSTLLFVSTQAITAPIQIDLVTVDSPNNPPDERTNLGSVPYTYQIGTFDITVAQYGAFLNAVAKEDPYQLYDEAMETDDAVACIKRLGKPGSHYYQVMEGRERLPIVLVTWYSAARFCNWMSNGQPTGPEGPLTTEDGSYLFLPDSVTLQKGATWRLPTDNEWYKAAYYNKSNPTHYWTYTTQSDLPPGNSILEEDNQADSSHKNANYSRNQHPSVEMTHLKPYLRMYPFGIPDFTPVGLFHSSPGPFGTYDMGGNVNQWTMTQTEDHASPSLLLKGYSRYTGLPWNKVSIDNTASSCQPPWAAPCDTGFRLVYCEPSKEVMAATATFSLPPSSALAPKALPRRTWNEYWNSWYNWL